MIKSYRLSCVLFVSIAILGMTNCTQLQDGGVSAKYGPDAKWDSKGIPIFGYHEDVPIYGYNSRGFPIYYPVNLTHHCVIPDWAPLPTCTATYEPAKTARKSSTPPANAKREVYTHAKQGEETQFDENGTPIGPDLSQGRYVETKSYVDKTAAKMKELRERKERERQGLPALIDDSIGATEAYKPSLNSDSTEGIGNGFDIYNNF